MLAQAHEQGLVLDVGAAAAEVVTEERRQSRLLAAMSERASECTAAFVAA